MTSCSEEDLDPTLAQDKSIETSVSTAGDIEVILNGAYNRMSLSDYYGRDFIILGEVMSDNTYSNANSNRFVIEAQMDLNSESGIAETLWARMYTVIGSANVVIGAEGLSGDEDRINHIKGQAYALRALAHFNLLQFYGQQNVSGGGESALGVPYVTAFRDNDNLFPARNTAGEVKQFAYDDLDMAVSLMSEGLNAPSKEYMTTWGALAVKARIANYFEDWQISLESSEAVVNSGQFDVLSRDEFLPAFDTDSDVSAIFEIANTPTDNPGINGLANIYQTGSYGDVVALPNLAAIYEDGDIRGVSDYDPATALAPETVIGLHPDGALRNVGKFPSTAPYEDNIAVIRYEEMVLVYAEALLETGNAAEALTWLNMIPENRGASSYSEATKDNILLERRKELAFEGFRFHDLARTEMDIPAPDSILQTHGGPAYGSYNFALPIPFAEVDVNANLEQNEGY
ncbi:RagB/SusD family nutrient uptake outer membrane protein [Christiangramia aestuarii]